MTQYGASTTVQTTPELGFNPVALDVDVGAAPVGVERCLDDSLRAFYENGDLCDIALVGAQGDTFFKAHQTVLAAAGVRFREQLTKALEHARSAACEHEPAKATEANAAAAASVETAPPLAVTPHGAPTAAVPVHGLLELRFHEVSRSEALKLLLDHIYAAETIKTCQPPDDNVIKDVLRLASMLEVPKLQDRAARWLVKGLSTDNVVGRLAMCEEFEMSSLFDKISEQVVASNEALAALAAGDEVLSHPKILQSLLIQTATLCVDEEEVAAAVREAEANKKRGRPSEDNKSPPAKQAKKGQRAGGA
eukprot:gnl/TRDRNA2_/TRDRNA2_186739_c0_seq1.p1 gnl/TRDRNA2_/TRDRNA2_186739_c0~~gnl/TRDRNA2_/TRDRNA2_186739_c0_seq1.p1  ORF type:complete len:307 (-),score=68.05 gnl/TRDRNA2_/TRDRNA2_186739_c0_seq1:86-1006(-)